MEIFEKASRMKLRFETEKGNIGVEDVWDLPLTSARSASLDNLAKSLNRKLKDSEEESFVVASSAANTTLKLKFDIVKYVIAVRLDETNRLKAAAENKAKKDKILSLIAEKQDENLKGKSLEELMAMVNSL